MIYIYIIYSIFIITTSIPDPKESVCTPTQKAYWLTPRNRNISLLVEFIIL